ncbi:MAG: veratrol--corrinoid protein metyltransferase [Lachnospiraceae bacterium]|nr:veratrol--corrinoid protein metyltransferase [Lachnospiraceae bacterium]
MTKLTEKENYLRLLRGEFPEWIPMYAFGPNPDGTPTSQIKCFSGPLIPHRMVKKPAKDLWGVTYVDVEGGDLPEPNNFILEDVTKWQDVIHAPDVSDFDWEKVAKQDLARWNVDRSQTALTFVLHTGFFQGLMSFMGFNEGLCALVEEPEACQELFNYMSDFYMYYLEHIIDYIKPDIIGITDDIATWANPFISPELYREMLKPLYARHAKFATDRGLPIDMHCCGRCEDFIDDWLDFGVTAWQPAQVSNDLLAIKEKYGRTFVICGGFDMTPELADPNCPKEAVVDAVKKTIDKLAPGGGYSCCASFLGAPGDKIVQQKNAWVRETVREYGANYYR